MSSRGHARALLPAVVAVVALACCMSAAAAQVTTTGAGAGGAGGAAVPSCASNLVTCAGYLNTTDTPPASCCGPLKEAACMCAILMNRAVLQAFGVVPEQGLLLAKRCGVTTEASTCARYTSAGAGAATAGSIAASSASTGNVASTVTKPTPSRGTTHHLSLIAASSLVGFSFIWWTIVV